MTGRDDSNDIARAVARAQRPVVLLVLFLVVLMALPWVGAGYCVTMGGRLCPAFLSPQSGGAPVAQPERGPDAAPPTARTDMREPPKPGAPPAGANPRANPKWVAIVVGNSDYRAPNALANPRNDATDMAKALSRLGYTLVSDEAKGSDAWFDTSYSRLDEAMRRFGERAADAEVALIYYAGHGMEEGGTNYLIPVDARLDRDVDLANQGYAFDAVVRRLPRFGVSIVIIDACRTPRFPLADRSGTTRAVEGQRGFQAVDAPDRALFAFSAGQNQRASDGNPGERNSPYTRDLLGAMNEPDAPIETVFKTVRQRFIDRGEAQKPEFRDNLGRPNLAFAPPEPARKPGERFRDCETRPEMIVLPAGSFTMGAPVSEEGSDDDERPQRKVTIPRDFAVGRFEVTFAEWDACVKGGGCNGHVPGDEGWGRGRQPVINVSWLEAQAYVQWLNSQPTKGRGKYRLLSEAEWEYAARAGTTTAFSFGNNITPAQARFNSDRTAAVGSFPANRFGLHDMHGNVWEWTEDCWNDSYAGAPSNGGVWRTGDCSRRVLRGGSWGNIPQFLRSAYRRRSDPSFRVDYFGFRVARTL
jgi:formylglycine-generating enzyme required for sulfatase activity